MKDRKTYDVVIVGGYGHIGLPFGLKLADSGLKVGLCDTNQASGELIRSGKLPFMERDADPILKRVLGKTLDPDTGLPEAGSARCVVITVGTPIDEYLNPRLLPLVQLFEELSPHLRRNQQIILRSTVYPGTSRRIRDFLWERKKKIHLSFCPERVSQGHAIREMGKFPQIISGFSDSSIRFAGNLFRRIRVPFVRLAVEEAELAKLFTNTWRYLRFAIANQFYMLSAMKGLDFKRIHYAMTHGYERARDFPMPGFSAGPCLLKDTMQLSALFKNHFQLGHAAMLINEGLPVFIVDQLQRKKNLRNQIVGILGMSFKADSDDIRDSLSYKLVKLLRFHGARVLCSDEFVKNQNFVTKEELLRRSSVVIVGVPHTAYKRIVVPRRTHLVDVWGCVKRRSN